MKRDITGKEDIKHLVDHFYESVITDEKIGHIFVNALGDQLDAHMPIMYRFWDSLLFSTAEYRGNPILTHLALHQKEKLTEDHFDRWVSLWEKSIDEHYTGTIASLAKQKANQMKQLMLYKIRASENPNFIQ